MYHTIWIDIISGKDNFTPEKILDEFKEFNKQDDVKYIEMGIVFEDWDVFAIVDIDNSDDLVKFLIKKICPIDGIEEVRMGNLNLINKALTPLDEDKFDTEEHMYFLVYLDA